MNDKPNDFQQTASDTGGRRIAGEKGEEKPTQQNQQDNDNQGRPVHTRFPTHEQPPNGLENRFRGSEYTTNQRVFAKWAYTWYKQTDSEGGHIR